MSLVTRQHFSSSRRPSARCTGAFAYVRVDFGDSFERIDVTEKIILSLSVVRESKLHAIQSAVTCRETTTTGRKQKSMHSSLQYRMQRKANICQSMQSELFVNRGIVRFRCASITRHRRLFSFKLRKKKWLNWIKENEEETQITVHRTEQTRSDSRRSSWWIRVAAAVFRFCWANHSTLTKLLSHSIVDNRFMVGYACQYGKYLSHFKTAATYTRIPCRNTSLAIRTYSSSNRFQLYGTTMAMSDEL